jgi:hypothetical protein
VDLEAATAILPNLRPQTEPDREASALGAIGTDGGRINSRSGHRLTTGQAGPDGPGSTLERNSGQPIDKLFGHLLATGGPGTGRVRPDTVGSANMSVLPALCPATLKTQDQPAFRGWKL